MILAIAGVLLALMWPIYQAYRQADSASWEEVASRVIRSMESFQQEALTEKGAYQSGIHDPRTKESSIKASIGWAPSRWDRTRFEVRASGDRFYEVTATLKERSICRRYPGWTPCE